MTAKWTVGVDWGSSELKWVCIEKGRKSNRLMAYGRTRADDLRSIQQILQNPGFRNADFRVGFNDPNLVIKSIKIPEVPKNEFEDVMKWELNNVAPLNDKKIIFQAHKLQSEYLVFAIEQEIIEEKLKWLEQLGFPKANTLEPSVYASALLVEQRIESKNRTIGILDLGKEFAVVMVTSPEGLIFARSIPNISSQQLTKKIAGNLVISHEEAENHKITYKNEPREDGGILHDTLIQFIDQVTQEVVRSLDNLNIDELMLCGAGSQQYGLREYLQNQIAKPVSFVLPFSNSSINLDLSEFDQSKVLAQETLFTSAMGLII